MLITLDLTQYSKYKIYKFFTLILENILDIDLSENFNNLFYFLNILIDQFQYIYNLVENNNLFEKMSDNDIYNSDFMKYKRLIKNI